MTALLVALAGAVGCLARYAVGRLVVSASWPLGTFLVNVVGAFAMGLAIAYFASRGQLDSRVKTAITTGLLGGFTTYSAFALETVELVSKDRLVAAASYVVATVALAGFACALGLYLGRRWM